MPQDSGLGSLPFFIYPFPLSIPSGPLASKTHCMSMATEAYPPAGEIALDSSSKSSLPPPRESLRAISNFARPEENSWFSPFSCSTGSPHLSKQHAVHSTGHARDLEVILGSFLSPTSTSKPSARPPGFTMAQSSSGIVCSSSLCLYHSSLLCSYLLPGPRHYPLSWASCFPSCFLRSLPPMTTNQSKSLLCLTTPQHGTP